MAYRRCVNLTAKKILYIIALKVMDGWIGLTGLVEFKGKVLAGEITLTSIRLFSDSIQASNKY